MQALQPATVQAIGFRRTGNILELPGIDQTDLETSFRQNLIERNPVNSRRFHGDACHTTGIQPVCNLKQIDGAKATWALEEKKHNVDVPGDADLFGATRYIRDKPECPANGVYTLQQVDAKPTCSLRAAPELHVLPGAP